jgi:hypothetical protein
MQGIMNVLDRTGHTEYAWAEGATSTEVGDGPLDPAFVAAEFDRLRAEGHLAFVQQGKENIQLLRDEPFDPLTHERVTMVPAFQGG